jgi:hypothetical protein
VIKVLRFEGNRDAVLLAEPLAEVNQFAAF